MPCVIVIISMKIGLNVTLVHQEKQAGDICVMAWGLAMIVVKANTAAVADVNSAIRANTQTKKVEAVVKTVLQENILHIKAEPETVNVQVVQMVTCQARAPQGARLALQGSTKQVVPFAMFVTWVRDQTLAQHLAPIAPPANTEPVIIYGAQRFPLIIAWIVHLAGDQTLAQHRAPNAPPVNTIPVILVKTAMQAMVPRLVHQAKRVVGLVPKVRVLYQEAHARHVLRANTKTKLLKALVNYVLRVNI